MNSTETIRAAARSLGWLSATATAGRWDVTVDPASTGERMVTSTVAQHRPTLVGSFSNPVDAQLASLFQPRFLDDVRALIIATARTHHGKSHLRRKLALRVVGSPDIDQATAVLTAIADTATQGPRVSRGTDAHIVWVNNWPIANASNPADVPLLTHITPHVAGSLADLLLLPTEAGAAAAALHLASLFTDVDQATPTPLANP